MKLDRAIVIGGGIAGLLAARILSDKFSSVVIVEKDESVGASVPRKGVPQGAHLHVLLRKGQRILSELFPGIEEHFASCVEVDWALDTDWNNRLGSFPRYKSDVRSRVFSRPFLEHFIYHETLKRQNVSILKSKVVGFGYNNGEVSEVLCLDQKLSCDLVVLAGGSYFPLKHFFPGFPIDKVTISVPIGISYRSVSFASESLQLPEGRQYYYQFLPPEDCLGAVISPVEGGKTIATLIEQGGKGSFKKGDIAGYLALAKAVPGQEVQRILELGRPLTGVAVFQKNHMYLRRLDKIGNWPSNLFAMGDVVCSLNPVFGQGMSVAFMQALSLRKNLDGNTISSRLFHSAIRRDLYLPFLLSKMGSDFRDGFVRRYLLNYLKHCQRSRKTHRRFLCVLHLEGSLLNLFHFGALLSAALGRKP